MCMCFECVAEREAREFYLRKESERMPKNKENPSPATTLANDPNSSALVLFGGITPMLPSELEQMGLGEYVEVQEIPGVSPSWTPVNPGDFLLGRCIDKRTKKFDVGTPEEREATVLVFDTAVPGGFRSVWLGTDLEIKLGDPIGKVYQLFYEGESRPSARSKRLNPMKNYRVMEIKPTKKLALPQDIDETEG
jgi:hypothetical protein